MAKKTKEYYLGHQIYASDRVVQYRVERHFSLLLRYIKDKKTRILDVGCYGGNLLRLLHEHGHTRLYGTDIETIDEPLLEILHDFRQGDLLQSTPYPKNSFDVVIISHVLEHVFDVERFLYNANSMLRPGGMCLLAVPNDTTLTARVQMLFKGRISSPFVAGGHIKFFHHQDFEQYLVSQGYSIVEKQYLGLGYGLLDLYLGPVSRTLAQIWPALFAGEYAYLVQKKRS